MVKNSIRIALVTTALETEAKDFVKSIDSIRQQTLVPHFVRIIDVDKWIHRSDPDSEVAEAIRNLKLFCPNVLVLPIHIEDGDNGYLRAVGTLKGNRYYDVLVDMVKPLQLEKKALYDLTEPFYTRNVYVMKGRANHIVVDGPKYLRRMKQRKLRKNLSAFRKSAVDEFLA